MERKVQVVNATPQHPRGEPSTIQVLIDLGLKSRTLTTYEITPKRAVELAEQLISSALIVGRVNKMEGWS